MSRPMKRHVRATACHPSRQNIQQCVASAARLAWLQGIQRFCMLPLGSAMPVHAARDIHQPAGLRQAFPLPCHPQHSMGRPSKLASICCHWGSQHGGTGTMSCCSRRQLAKRPQSGTTGSLHKNARSALTHCTSGAEWAPRACSWSQPQQPVWTVGPAAWLAR